MRIGSVNQRCLVHERWLRVTGHDRLNFVLWPCFFFSILFSKMCSWERIVGVLIFVFGVFLFLFYSLQGNTKHLHAWLETEFACWSPLLDLWTKARHKSEKSKNLSNLSEVTGLLGAKVKPRTPDSQYGTRTFTGIVSFPFTKSFLDFPPHGINYGRIA